MKDVLPWFVLKSVPGIGNLLFKRLLDRFESPENVLGAPAEDLLGVEGMNRRLASRIQRHPVPEWARKELDLARRHGYRIVTRHHPAYPPLLGEIPDPPPFLYVYGNLEPLTRAVALVGSRGATPYGLATTRRLSDGLARLGITVVSGMARGIDTAAHQGAMDAGGRTIAVLGSGLCRIYPAENGALFHRIAKHGAVISELPLTAEPEAHHFPARNRIISGISLGTVVVEATRKSGSLITARLAAEQNREVFAVPGSVQSFKSMGTHTLIKQGAKLVEHVQDIVEEFPFAPPPPPGTQIASHMADMKQKWALTPEESMVFNALGPYPVHIDELVRALSMEPGKLAGILLKLELKGAVAQSAGKLFSIDAKG